MKIIILLLCVFFAVNVKSQNIEKIKKQNTFFILFNETSQLTKFGCIKEDINPSCNYRFYKNNKKEFEYSFFYNKYSSIDEAYDKINQNIYFRINKSFLRKNKDIIITRVFMEKVGDRKMISLLDDDASNKTIFLINTADTKNGKILLREVTIDYMKEE
jgi:hypothetical protein